MAEHVVDRLLGQIEVKGSPVCVGLDPAVERLPESLRTGRDPVEAIRDFCREVIEIVAPIVPAVKPQSAYFEVHGGPGVALYHEVVGLAKDAGLIVIGDIKRSDIGSTAQAYAAAHLAGPDTPDLVTVNGYLGADGLTPFVDVAREQDKGIFVLVRTSNPSGGSVQDFANADGKKLYEHIAEQVAALGGHAHLIGSSGYSCVGAVVGATYPAEARRLREIMPRQVFLVPGYGAQGASAADCAASFKADGTGAIVNASRSVLFAYQREEYAGLDWPEATRQAARAFADDIAQALNK